MRKLPASKDNSTSEVMVRDTPEGRQAAEQCANHWQCTPGYHPHSVHPRRAHATQLPGQLCTAAHI